METLIDLKPFHTRVARSVTFRRMGKVKRVTGLVIESEGPPVSIGDLCHVYSHEGDSVIKGEVVGFKDSVFYIMPYGSMEGIAPGCRVVSTGRPLKVPVGMNLQGRVINGVGEPIDGKGPITGVEFYSTTGRIPPAMKRPRIKSAFHVGIKAVDSCLTLGMGQRVGIFSGSGVGKSTLLGMMARGAESQLNVIALIGERGREVREFIEESLGEEGLKRSVVVAVTSDEPALMRIKGAYTATAVAEYFREKGLSVLFMMDSITRFAMAQREIGLSIGEPPTTKGYTPSVFTLLPRLMERTGMSAEGAITALYTVLVDADDFNEPISDACRSILDGHIMLQRRLAAANHYPAIDLLDSVSRLSVDVCTEEQLRLAKQMKELVSVYEEARDLINIGAYVSGSNPKIDEAISKIDAINAFLIQGIREMCPFEETMMKFRAVFEK